MTSPDATAIALNEAAEELGVHYQTAYRWVRTGKLPATLVRGKYVVDRDDLLSAQSRRHTPLSPAPPSPRRVQNQMPLMNDALRRGDETTARQIARTLVDEGTPVIQLINDVLVPPLRSIGEEWHGGRLSIWVEHRASAIVDRLLGDVTPNRRGRRRGNALVAAVSGDLHSLPTTMAAVTLRDANWSVHHLGADVPPEELLSFVASEPVDVAVLSSTNSATRTLAEHTAGQLESHGVPTVLGRAGATLTDLLAAVDAATAS